MHHQSSHLDDNNVGHYCSFKAFNIWAFTFWKKLKENPSVIGVSYLARTLVNSICLNNSCIIIIHVVIISSNKLINIYIFRLLIIQNHWSQLWGEKNKKWWPSKCLCWAMSIAGTENCWVSPVINTSKNKAKIIISTSMSAVAHCRSCARQRQFSLQQLVG